METISASADKNKKVLEKFTKLWDEIKDQIEKKKWWRTNKI